MTQTSRQVNMHENVHTAHSEEQQHTARNNSTQHTEMSPQESHIDYYRLHSPQVVTSCDAYDIATYIPNTGKDVTLQTTKILKNIGLDV